ncbi:MAG TPA: MFS transporter [Gaiellaceae bacterium]|jgi:EmrB/QacA subfamily drug resistance transporter
MAAFTLDQRRTLTLAATVVGSSLAFIDATVVFVALPTIGEDLDLGLTGQQWVVLSYSLALAALYLVGGAIGDRYGRRPTFIVGTAGFALASVFAGFAPSGSLLILARTLQGVAGAFLTTNSLALLRGVYGDEAGRAIGLWTAFTSVATVAGPPIGGALVEWVSWRWIFFINIPLAVLTVVLARAGQCNEQKMLRVGRLDIPGATLAAVGFGALTYGLVEGPEKGFGQVWWAFALSVPALVAFCIVESRSKNAMLPFDLFRRRNFAMANLETFVVYGALYVQLIFTQLYLQFIGFSPFEASLVTIPGSAILIFLAARFGKLADQHGPRLYLTAGPFLVGIGTLLILPVKEKSDFWTWGIASVLVFAFGLAMLVAPITATALKSAPAEFAGIASGVNSTVSRLGNLIAVASAGVVVSLVYDSKVDRGVPLAKNQVDPALRDASISGFRVAMIVAACLAFAGALVGALGIVNREDEPAGVSEREPAPAGN